MVRQTLKSYLIATEMHAGSLRDDIHRTRYYGLVGQNGVLNFDHNAFNIWSFVIGWLACQSFSGDGSVADKLSVSQQSFTMPSCLY